MPLNIIIIALIVLVVLVVIWLIFSGKMKDFGINLVSEKSKQDKFVKDELPKAFGFPPDTKAVPPAAAPPSQPNSIDIGG